MRLAPPCWMRKVLLSATLFELALSVGVCGCAARSSDLLQSESGGTAGAGGAGGAETAQGGNSGNGGGGSGGGAATCYAPGSEVDTDPEFMGCLTASWTYGRYPVKQCIPPLPLPTRADRSGAALILDAMPRAESGLRSSAGAIQFSVERRASPVAVLSWGPDNLYSVVALQDDFQPGELLAVSAPGDALPAFSGQLTVPAQVQLTLPAYWQVPSGEPGDAGSADELAAAGYALSPRPPTELRWSSDNEDGVLEIELTSRFQPDAESHVDYLFCRTPLSAHELAIPAFPFYVGSSYFQRTNGSARAVVRVDSTPNGAGVRLHAERLIANISGFRL